MKRYAVSICEISNGRIITQIVSANDWIEALKGHEEIALFERIVMPIDYTNLANVKTQFKTVWAMVECIEIP